MLGQELVKIFRKDKDYKVFAWDREELDIVNQKQVDKKISELKTDIIINSAAYNAVDECEEPKEYKKALLINGKAPGYLAKAAKKIGATFIHYSTDYVFDGSPRFDKMSHRVEAGDFSKFLEPVGCAHICQTCSLHKNFHPVFGYKEEAKPKPISNYGKSKLLGEKEIQKVKGKNYIIRLSKLFGKPGRGENIKKSFFETMLELGKKNKIVKAVDEEISCFTYAPDLAKKTKEIIEARKTFGIYHIVNGGPCTWYEAVLELYRQARVRIKVVPVSANGFPRPAKRPAFSVLINTKLNPLRNYKEALKDYLKENL